MKTANFLFCLLATVLLTACGFSLSRPTAPARPLQANIQAAYRVDIVGGGHGSGTVISHDGHILTAEHVVRGHRRIGIAIDAGGPYPETHLAEVVFADEDTDVAVIKIDRHFDRVAWLGTPDEPRLGLRVYTAGYSAYFGQLYHRGTIGALHFSVPLDDDEKAEPRGQNLMLCDLPIAPGDSGGGVFSEETGHLIGLSNGVMPYKRGILVISYTFVQPIEKILDGLDEYQIPYNKP